MGVRKAAELVVLGGIQAVHGDAHGGCAGLLQAPGHLVGDERAVAAEHRAQTLGRGVRHELKDVIAHERLTAAENHDFEAGARDLLDHRLALDRC